MKSKIKENMIKFDLSMIFSLDKVTVLKNIFGIVYKIDFLLNHQLRVLLYIIINSNMVYHITVP